MPKTWKIMLALVVLMLLGSPVTAQETEAIEPEHVEVQHILISFKGAPLVDAVRSQAEAETLAQEVLFKARQGADFGTLVKEFTDDSFPGIYLISNRGVQPDGTKKEVARHRMVKSFGDVSFKLKIGEIGMASYHPQNSKYGWHIIKRLK